MTKSSKWVKLSYVLRRNSWIVAFAYRIWRLFQTKYTMGVVGVIFDDNQRVLLVEHVFHPKRPWGLPGGWINRREDPKHALARELQEELKLNVNMGDILLAEFHHGNHLDLAYVCEPINEIGELSFELLQYQWFNIEDMPKLHLFHQRAITHAINLQTKSNNQ